MHNVGLRAPTPPAVVVGACAHGLSVIRALSGHGFEIFIVDSNTELPGSRTKLARFLRVDEDINTIGIVSALASLHNKLWINQKPVLFLTNDKMVLNVSKNWEELSEKYLVSWASHRELISKLIIKTSLENHCKTVGMLYPKSFIVECFDNLKVLAPTMRYPIMVKPAQPLSEFKAEIAHSAAELISLSGRFPNTFPLILQDWIQGDDTHLFFCNLYLIDGQPSGRFEGHKIRSSPPCRGQGTVVEPLPSDEVFNLAMRFFSTEPISGPAALELKRDTQGRWWVIEPTLGRTEFLVGCCVANGVNIPLLEYKHQTGREATSDRQRSAFVWFNAERDSFGVIAYLFGRLHPQTRHLRLHFLYFSLADPIPFLSALKRDLTSLFRRGITKVLRTAKNRLTPGG